LPEQTIFTLNGAETTVAAPARDALLHILRNHLGLTGTRYGCGAEHCGSCMVLVDGVPVTSCSHALDSVAGRSVTTVEGIPAAIRDAFLAEQAGQCGYCLSGIMVVAAALLARNPSPTRADIVAALDGNLCRCGAHPRILRAVERAADTMRVAA
jgi:nicotinate dehydrogenase subunit A